MASPPSKASSRQVGVSWSEEPPRTIVATHNRLFEDLYVISGIDDNSRWRD